MLLVFKLFHLKVKLEYFLNKCSILCAMCRTMLSCLGYFFQRLGWGLGSMTLVVEYQCWVLYFGEYHIVTSTSPSRIEAHASLFRSLMKGIFDPYVL